MRRPERPVAAKPGAYRLLLEYDGSRYQGWQKQGPKQTAQGVRTVAGTLERVLAEAGYPVASLGGSGRTDAGVHALGQVAHLHLSAGKNPKPWELQRILDEGLPGDVALRAIAPCPMGFHARHEALSRTYLYQISQRRTAFAKPYVWWVKAPMDLGHLEEAWSAFQGNRDMSSFADLEKGEDPHCQIHALEFVLDGALVLLRVTAGHFLHRQVRRMVGAAVLCALGREKVRRITQDLDHPTPEANLFWGASAAPASGLFLEQVHYPDGPGVGPARPETLVL
jgi:tRNA pseudouridine38-40 synthase